MVILRAFAPAKINLYLHVTGKRADGYHELDSLVVFTTAGDVIEALPSDRLSLAIEGPFGAALNVKENSVMKAAELLHAHSNTQAGAALTLHKRLPVAAGIGGGSSDAAAALKLLVRLWNLRLTAKELHSLALKLGSDVPACLQGGTLYMQGIGEKIEPGPTLSVLHLVLVNPGKPLLTPTVFKAYRPPYSSPARRPKDFISAEACLQFLGKQKNDLEPVAIKLLPEIERALAALTQARDCHLARMSGSGATCFGIFTSKEAALQAEQRISAQYPSWWVKAADIG